MFIQPKRKKVQDRYIPLSNAFISVQSNTKAEILPSCPGNPDLFAVAVLDTFNIFNL